MSLAFRGNNVIYSKKVQVKYGVNIKMLLTPADSYIIF